MTAVGAGAGAATVLETELTAAGIPHDLKVYPVNKARLDQGAPARRNVRAMEPPRAFMTDVSRMNIHEPPTARTRCHAASGTLTDVVATEVRARVWA